jgi:dihydroorotate dehydrogenase electron transfer subunit
MPPIDVAATVVANRRLSSDYNVLTLSAPGIGAQTLAGQFVMVRPEMGVDTILRRPFSVFEVVRDGAGRPTAISILNKRAGPTTNRLYELDGGDRVACLGPLGKPFTPVSPPIEGWMVAGGVGLAPFATLAEALAGRGTPTTLFYGARSANELFYLDFFEQHGVRLVLATEDGSRGDRGRVTVPLERALRGAGRHVAADGEAEAAGGGAEAPPYESPPFERLIYACGPEAMLAAVARLAMRFGQPSEVSVERTMGCGLGGCYSCVIPVKHGDEHAHLVRSCITGPVFDGAEIAWG